MSLASPSQVDTPISKVCDLSEVLAYKNDSIVWKFLESWDVSFEEADDLFTETKKWLWLQAVANTEREEGNKVPELFVDNSLSFLDEMWHCFILFTRPYHVFCDKFFCMYIHHAPTTKAEKDAIKAEFEQHPDKVRENREQELEEMYTYIYDKLGEDTLVKWFSDYPDKYTPEWMNDQRKPIAAV